MPTNNGKLDAFREYVETLDEADASSDLPPISFREEFDEASARHERLRRRRSRGDPFEMSMPVDEGFRSYEKDIASVIIPRALKTLLINRNISSHDLLQRIDAPHLIGDADNAQDLEEFKALHEIFKTATQRLWSSPHSEERESLYNYLREYAPVNKDAVASMEVAGKYVIEFFNLIEVITSKENSFDEGGLVFDDPTGITQLYIFGHQLLDRRNKPPSSFEEDDDDYEDGHEDEDDDLPVGVPLDAFSGSPEHFFALLLAYRDSVTNMASFLGLEQTDRLAGLYSRYNDAESMDVQEEPLTLPEDVSFVVQLMPWMANSLLQIQKLDFSHMSPAEIARITKQSLSKDDARSIITESLDTSGYEEAEIDVLSKHARQTIQQFLEDISTGNYTPYIESLPTSDTFTAELPWSMLSDSRYLYEASQMVESTIVNYIARVQQEQEYPDGPLDFDPHTIGMLKTYYESGDSTGVTWLLEEHIPHLIRTYQVLSARSGDLPLTSISQEMMESGMSLDLIPEQFRGRVLRGQQIRLRQCEQELMGAAIYLKLMRDVPDFLHNPVTPIEHD